MFTQRPSVFGYSKRKFEFVTKKYDYSMHKQTHYLLFFNIGRSIKKQNQIGSRRVNKRGRKIVIFVFC